jgi:hypothetical protein
MDFSILRKLFALTILRVEFGHFYSGYAKELKLSGLTRIKMPKNQRVKLSKAKMFK